MKLRLSLSWIIYLALGVIGATTSQSGTDQIVVRADQTLAPVSPLLFGQNFGPWMNTTAGYIADYREAVAGFRPAGQARVWLQDEAHLAAQLPAVAVDKVFPYTFPPYSVTLFILEPAPSANWRLWASLGLAMVALAVATGWVRRFRRSC